MNSSVSNSTAPASAADPTGSASYREAGVDTAAGDLAVELMKAAVQKTHGPEVQGGVGGFAGLFDASALVGGETAEHPGLLGPDDYDVAGAATGVVEADDVRGAHLVADGDVVLALESSGLHSNGFSLVRHILAQRGIGFTDHSDDFGGMVGEALLEPTRLYTSPLVDLLADETLGRSIHSLSHVTGGGIAANLARVLPVGSWVEVDRSTWSPAPVFRILSDLAGTTLESAEGTWNLSIGFFAVVSAADAAAIATHLTNTGIPTWPVGTIHMGERDLAGFEQGAKGVDGGAVRLVGSYAS